MNRILAVALPLASLMVFDQALAETISLDCRWTDGSGRTHHLDISSSVMEDGKPLETGTVSVNDNSIYFKETAVSGFSRETMIDRRTGELTQTMSVTGGGTQTQSIPLVARCEKSTASARKF